MRSNRRPQASLLILLMVAVSTNAQCRNQDTPGTDRKLAEENLEDKSDALIRLSESSRSALGKMDFARQNAVQRVFTAIWELESEVNNGGFHQYFFNHSGESAVGVLSALEAIGAHRTRQIVAEAMARLPGGKPLANTDERRRLLNDVDEETWADLDQAFFKYPDNLTELLYAFVKSHPEEFGSDF
jgi:hypothetical protein